jgi:hypothetical protein
MSATALLLVGVLLCFAGALSARLAVLAAGLSVSWLLADVFGASFLTGLLIGIAGGVVALVLTIVLSHIVMFVTGALLGAVLGAKLFIAFDGSDPSWLLAVFFVPAIGITCGFLASRYQRAFLRWATAFAGAALVLTGLGMFDSSSLDMLYRPDSTADALLLTVAWVALGLAGHAVQGRIADRRSESKASA